jgi:hypothetical protein
LKACVSRPALPLRHHTQAVTQCCANTRSCANMAL